MPRLWSTDLPVRLKNKVQSCGKFRRGLRETAQREGRGGWGKRERGKGEDDWRFRLNIDIAFGWLGKRN